MGQGAESAGCYEYDSEYEYLENCQERGVWPQRTGGEIPIAKMTESHLHNAIAHVKKLAARSTFECNSDMWEGWAEMFELELASRQLKKHIPEDQPKKAPPVVRGATQLMRCHCGTEYYARVADLKRGWGAVMR